MMQILGQSYCVVTIHQVHIKTVHSCHFVMFILTYMTRNITSQQNATCVSIHIKNQT